MSERLADYAYDIRNSIPEIVEVLQQKEELAKRVEELENHLNKADESLVENGKKIMKLTDEKAELEFENQRYKQALEEVLITDEFEDPQDYIDRIVTKASEALEQEND